MAHNVKFSMPERELGKASLEFKVKINGNVLGTLKVSKGTVVWVQRDREIGYQMNWTKFGDLMQKEGQKQLRRR